MRADVGKPIHRRDAEIAENTQREKMKRVMRKERTKRRNEEKRREEKKTSSPFHLLSVFSLRSLRLCSE
jgi:hypothetical protein